MRHRYVNASIILIPVEHLFRFSPEALEKIEELNFSFKTFPLDAFSEENSLSFDHGEGISGMNE